MELFGPKSAIGPALVALLVFTNLCATLYLVNKLYAFFSVTGFQVSLTTVCIGGETLSRALVTFRSMDFFGAFGLLPDAFARATITSTFTLSVCMTIVLSVIWSRQLRRAVAETKSKRLSRFSIFEVIVWLFVAVVVVLEIASTTSSVINDQGGILTVLVAALAPIISACVLAFSGIRLLRAADALCSCSRMSFLIFVLCSTTVAMIIALGAYASVADFRTKTLVADHVILLVVNVFQMVQSFANGATFVSPTRDGYERYLAMNTALANDDSAKQSVNERRRSTREVLSYAVAMCAFDTYDDFDDDILLGFSDTNDTDRTFTAESEPEFTTDEDEEYV